jgi:hypothetical protein
LPVSFPVGTEENRNKTKLLEELIAFFPGEGERERERERRRSMAR